MSNVIVQEKLRGIVAKILPNFVNDGNESAIRSGKYGELLITPIAGKAIGAVEEGSYFVSNNPTPGTGVKLQGDTTTALVATTPSILIMNNDPVGPAGKNIVLDYIKLIVTGAGAGLARLVATAYVDGIKRYASGGTAVTTIANTNMSSSRGSAAQIYYAATAAAANSARLIGQNILRGAIPVVDDVYLMDFGGSPAVAATGTDGTTTIMTKGFHFPPVVIGPQQSFLLYLWAASMSTSPATEFEIGWIER